MIEVRSYVGRNNEDLKDLMIKLDMASISPNERGLYIGQVELYQDKKAELYHYMSATIIVVGEKDKSRISVFASHESQENIKKGLESKLGIRLS